MVLLVEVVVTGSSGCSTALLVSYTSPVNLRTAVLLVQILQVHWYTQSTHQSNSDLSVSLSVSLQKLAVRSCPVGTTKPLSLIKPSTQGIAISVVPAKAPVSMVTAHINGQKAASSEPLQTSPINLQMGGRVASAGVHPFSSRRAGELPPSQVTLLRAHTWNTCPSSPTPTPTFTPIATAL